MSPRAAFLRRQLGTRVLKCERGGLSPSWVSKPTLGCGANHLAFREPSSVVHMLNVLSRAHRDVSAAASGPGSHGSILRLKEPSSLSCRQPTTWLLKEARCQLLHNDEQRVQQWLVPPGHLLNP